MVPKVRSRRCSEVFDVAEDLEEPLWPAMGPTSEFSSLIGEVSARHRPSVSLVGTGGGLATAHEILDPDAQAPSTERIERTLGIAFDRLWCDRPGEDPDDAQDAQLEGTVDSFISSYFRHVAELSRESVYQAHQRAILSRMREDIMAGDRSGNMRDLDERIQRVELSDKSLQAEIANLMRITEKERRQSCCAARSPCCSGATACCASETQTEVLLPVAPRDVDGCQGCALQ